MITNVSKKIYRAIARNNDGRKALAFAIYLKNAKPASVIKDWSYRELSRLTGLSPTTCKKRVSKLKEAGLIRMSEKNGHQYLHIAVLRSVATTMRWVDNKKKKHSNIKRRKMDNLPFKGTGWGSVKDIELALMGIGICDEIRRKEFAKQLVETAYNPSPFISSKRVKRARRSCDKRGYGKVFTETGFSYRRMMKWFHCGTDKIKNAVAFGESTEMFQVIRPGFVHVAYIGGGVAKQAVKQIQYAYEQHLFATKNNVYYKPSLIFLPMEADSRLY